MAQSSHDVFLSHSSKDNEFVKELYRRLTRDGVRCFFDSVSIGWGDNWVKALERAIDECSGKQLLWTTRRYIAQRSGRTQETIRS